MSVSSQLWSPNGSSRRWVLAFALLALLLGLAIVHPPFTIRPLASPSTSAIDHPNRSVASAFIDKIWAATFLPFVQKNARDLNQILPELKRDPEKAGSAYGHRTANNPYNYLVKGSGKILEVNTKSRAGTLTVQLGGSNEKVTIRIGPVVFGSALRDATDLVPFSDFTNQIEFADASREMNIRAVKEALDGRDPKDWSGKGLQFIGAMTFQPSMPIAITPVQLGISP